MARGVNRSPEEKAAALAALLAGQSVDQVAAEYKIPGGTVKSWLREVNAIRRAEDVVNGRSAIGDLILDYLAALLIAVKEIVNLVSQNPEWILRQDASQLAIFLGVLTDKLMRIVEALPKPSSSGADPDVP